MLQPSDNKNDKQVNTKNTKGVPAKKPRSLLKLNVASFALIGSLMSFVSFQVAENINQSAEATQVVASASTTDITTQSFASNTATTSTIASITATTSTTAAATTTTAAATATLVAATTTTAAVKTSTAAATATPATTTVTVSSANSNPVVVTKGS